eukprot:scaffold5.g986.t1
MAARRDWQHKSRATPDSPSCIESLFIDDARPLNLANSLGYQFPIDGCTTNSTLNSLQFCNTLLTSGSKPVHELDTWYGDAVSDTCVAMCAAGTWQAAANFVCGSACQASVQAACSSCQSGCQATCSSCQAGVTAACESCKVACCMGCQNNCKQTLNTATLTYKLLLSSIAGMGDIRAQSVLLVSTTPWVPGVSYPTATFEVTFLIPSLTVTGQFQGSLNPSYGIPPINEAVVKSTSQQVKTKTVVRVDHVCSAAANMRANTDSTEPSYSGKVTTSLGGSLTTNTADITVDLGAEMQAQWQDISASTGQALATGTGANPAVQKKVNDALNQVLAQAMDSVLWGWLECAYVPRSPPPPPPPLSPKPRSPVARSPPQP